MSNSQQNEKGLSVRDLITTGILAAFLYMVCAMIARLSWVLPCTDFPLPAVYCAAVRPGLYADTGKGAEAWPNHCHRYFGRRCTVRTRYVPVYVFGILYSRRCGRFAGRFREL